MANKNSREILTRKEEIIETFKKNFPSLSKNMNDKTILLYDRFIKAGKKFIENELMLEQR